MRILNLRLLRALKAATNLIKVSKYNVLSLVSMPQSKPAQEQTVRGGGPANIREITVAAASLQLPVRGNRCTRQPLSSPV